MYSFDSDGSDDSPQRSKPRRLGRFSLAGASRSVATILSSATKQATRPRSSLLSAKRARQPDLLALASPSRQPTQFQAAPKRPAAAEAVKQARSSPGDAEPDPEPDEVDDYVDEDDGDSSSSNRDDEDANDGNHQSEASSKTKRPTPSTAASSSSQPKPPSKPRASSSPSSTVAEETPTAKVAAKSAKTKKAASSSSRGGVPDRLPLVLPASVLARKPERYAHLLVHMTGGDVDMDGDVGAVGRLTTARDGVLLDLQGQRFAGAIVPCVTHAVVALGPSEARVEAVSSDAALLRHLDSALDRMGGSLVSGKAAEALLAFADVDTTVDPAADGEAAAKAAAGDQGVGEAGSQSGVVASGARKGKKKATKHEFFGTRRTATKPKQRKRK